MSIRDLRREYSKKTLTEAEASGDPLVLFEQWFDDAFRAEVAEPHAMALATVSAEGDPSVRTVLLRAYDARGFVFYTNYESAKGRDLEARPRASLMFFWPELERQIRITGAVERVSREESEDYFHSRPRDSQLGAWASPQSQVIGDRGALDDAYDSLEARHQGRDIPLPPFWGGYRVRPDRIEFWQGRPSRLHDRLLYERDANAWTRVRLAP